MYKGNYSVVINEVTKEISTKERVSLKLMSDVTPIDTLLEYNESVIIDVDYSAILTVHNEISENKDYKVFIYVDKEGNKYSSSSESLYETFISINEEFENVDEEWKMKVLKKPSKNYKGKDFFTCTVA